MPIGSPSIGVLHVTFVIALASCVAQTMLLKRMIQKEPEVWPGRYILLWVGLSDSVVFLSTPLVLVPLVMFS